MEVSTPNAGSPVTGGDPSGEGSGHGSEGGDSGSGGRESGDGARKDADGHKGHAGTSKKEAGEGTDGEGAESAKAKADAEKTKPAVKRYKLPTDDGGEEEVDEAEVKRRVVHAREANKRMEQAAIVQKRMEEFIEHLTTDPVAVLERLASQKRLKVDHIEAMEKRLAEHYKRQLMTPEQIKAEQDHADAEAYRQSVVKQREQAQQQQLNEAARHLEIEYDQKITAACNAKALPKSPETVKRVAGLMELAVKKGYEPNLDLIVDIVHKQYLDEHDSLYENMSEEELIKRYPKLADRIRKADLARLRSKFTPETPKPAPVPRQSNQRERLNPREFFEAAMKRAGVDK